MKATSKTLRLRTETGTVHEFRLRAGGGITVGRGAVDLKVDVPSVSREHCRFEVGARGEVAVVDLGSQNGTQVNGKPIRRAEVKTGDRVAIGVVAFTVEVADLDLGVSARRRPQERTAALDSRAVAAIMAAPAPPPAAEIGAGAPGSVRERLADLGLEVIEPLDRPGSAGQAQTFKARRRGLEDEVVVKVVPVSDRERAGRLLREARLAARARHRNIVQIHDVREVPGLVAIVLEHVPGRTLTEEVEVAASRRLAPGRAVEIALEVCRALAHAHALGVVHRNVTPHSIVLATDGSVKLSEFALAKSLTGGGGGPQITRVGQALGQVEYAAPEQRRDASSVDGRADIYSLGATLYYALTGEPPVVRVKFDDEGNPQEVEPEALGKFARDVPHPLRAVVGRCMRPEPKERYRTAEELLRALEGVFALLAPDVGARVSARLPAGGAGVSGFSGRVHGDELVELLQSAELNRKSGYLELFGEGQEEGSTIAGTIVLREGRIVEARSETAEGHEAALELLLLKKGSFSLFWAAPPANPDEQPIAVGPLLMEVCRRRDEAGRQA